ncbi:geranylgeranyl pyrophosphate synthetase [Planctomycetales bacterium]|nr:geranylgeranyl pyrophosphate synthetase [Planctomycetales bacterium]GHT34246.1 geranylgeranyl pyrophosphate synthetase [Planctomycetales bacterium]
MSSSHILYDVPGDTDNKVSEYQEGLRNETAAMLDKFLHFGTDCPKILGEAIRYSVLAPGKRLRPLLTLAVCDLCGGERQNALYAAGAVELIHAYSLIHDDLPAMDNDDLRRGIPTCHKKFDEATAILAGDAALALAFESIGNIEPAELAGCCCKELAVASGPCQLVGGQMDDVSRENAEKSGILYGWKEIPEVSRQLLERIHNRKTGALICVSVRLGAMIAGVSKEIQDLLEKFGIHFGLAFQITDDLIDVISDSKTAGKRTQKDEEKSKLSYPALLGIIQSQKEAEKNIQIADEALKQAAELLGNNALNSLPRLTLSTLAYSLIGRKK